MKDSSMERETNVAAIGVGAFMARQHLPNINRNPNIRIHTLCDLNEELLAQREKEYHPEKTTTNCEDVFTDPEVDAVIVGTRGAAHSDFIAMAAKYDKHIFVEKPMTQTYGETRKVLDVLKGKNINVGIGFNRRFAPSMVEAKQLFHSYKKDSANIIYRIVDDHRIRPHYIFDMDDGGGHLLAEGCHIFDLLAWFLDAEPVEIYATGPLETDNVLIIKYSDGSIATLVCGGKGGICYPKECMEVFCDNRTLTVDTFYEMRFDGPGENFIKTFPLAVKNRTEFAEDTMTEFYRKSFAARPDYDITGPHAANSLPTPAVDKGHSQAIAAFADAIVKGEKYSINAIDGARATVCALKGYESIKANLPVKISPADYGLE